MALKLGLHLHKFVTFTFGNPSGRDSCHFGYYRSDILCCYLSSLLRVLQAHHRAGLIHSVYSLVRQTPVCYVAIGHSYACLYRFVCINDVVMLFIIGLEPVKNRDRLLYVSVFYDDFLEPSVQGSILLYDFPELLEGSSSNALDLTSCQRWLEHIRCIQTSGSSTCPHYGMELIYEQYDIRTLGNLVDDGLKPLFEVTTIFRTGYDRA